MTTAKEIGKIFTGARTKLKLSVEDVCQQTHIHPKVIQDIENGVFDRLDKLYMKNFLKKYSAILGLDTAEILEQYETVFGDIPNKGTAFSTTQNNDEVLVSMNKKKHIIPIVITVVAISVVVLLFLLIGSLFKGSDSPKASEKEIVAEKTFNRKVASVVAKKTQAPVTIQKNVKLILKADNRVWIKVTEGKKTLFAGILNKGKSKKWDTTKTIKVWTGKAEVLRFTVDGKKLGVIAKGVVKNISISPEGVKIGNIWVTRL